MSASASRCIACLCLGAAVLWALPAAAQKTLGGSGQASSPANAQPVALLDVTDDLRKSLEAAKARLAAIEAGGESPADAPVGTPPFEISARLALARQLVSLYDKQQNTLERLERARERRRALDRAIESWRGFDGTPPRSVLTVDRLRDELDAAHHALASADETRTLLGRFEADFASKLKAAQGEARLAVEAADRARGTADYPRLDWLRNLAVLKADVDSATQSLLQLGLRTAQVEHDGALAQRDFARHKLIAAGSELALPRADLDRVYAEMELRRRASERALAAATRVAADARAAMAAAQTRQATELVAPAANGARRAELDRETTVAREVAGTADQKVFLLRELLTELQAERSVWEARATAIGLKDPVQARAVHDRLTEGLAGLRATKQYLRQELGIVTSRVRDEEARQRLAPGAESAAGRRLLAALREREADLRNSLDASAPLERLVAHFRADFEGRRDITVTERAKDVLAGAWLGVRQAWNYELVTIDDTLETTDGRKVAVSRSVTIGKTFGAVLIVVVGYLLASFVVRWIERRIVRSRRTTPQSAALVRKWILFVLSAVLAIFALFSASIPLTAFAFLGGALAIAAGFGLQTLLKNLVSGVMLLVERPLRLGDLVEVDGIRGRVTEIGIRASTIRSGDGTESMVPNSRFLEGNMTNWTYSSTTNRQTIAVGVAYGSPLRKVNEILNDVLTRHGLVLKDPPPQVYLDAYGDSSIDFSLTYWVDMTEQTDARRIKSDLLHMIDRAFEEAGIEIPYPQRDIRLSTADPVPVAIMPPAAGRAAA
jgi:small-conductance mechanosensitive channel